MPLLPIITLFTYYYVFETGQLADARTEQSSQFRFTLDTFLDFFESHFSFRHNLAKSLALRASRWCTSPVAGVLRVLRRRRAPNRNQCLWSTTNPHPFGPHFGIRPVLDQSEHWYQWGRLELYSTLSIDFLVQIWIGLMIHGQSATVCQSVLCHVASVLNSPAPPVTHSWQSLACSQRLQQPIASWTAEHTSIASCYGTAEHTWKGLAEQKITIFLVHTFMMLICHCTISYFLP